MAKAKTNDRLPELREFIKENDQQLYDFCCYMLHGGGQSLAEDLVLEIFREFGDAYGKMRSDSSGKWEPLEVRVRLFQIAWDRVREAMVQIPQAWSVGRDTRPLKSFDDDILGAYARDGRVHEIEPVAIERLARIDADFRAPVVLRDILKFDDEEVSRILGVRWGVYRHRLHRGRLEYKDILRGRPFAPEAKPLPSEKPSGKMPGRIP